MTGTQRLPEGSDAEIDLLLEAIYREFHYDFRRYSRSSLRRRLADALVSLGSPTLPDLRRRLLGEEDVFPALLRFLTVQVSDLFRDPPFFLTFRREIVPHLRTYPSLRVWVAGCSTGEEAYSFAVLLDEEGLWDKTILYATDINPESLRVAQAGIYPFDRLQRFADNHRLAGGRGPLSAHCTVAYGSAVFDRRLRTRIVFSDHSLSTDGGFAEMQLVSCRNVLIYFDRALQERALGLFTESLCRRGFLGLGSRETLRFTEREHDFAEIAERWYRRC